MFFQNAAKTAITPPKTAQEQSGNGAEQRPALSSASVAGAGAAQPCAQGPTISAPAPSSTPEPFESRLKRAQLHPCQAQCRPPSSGAATAGVANSAPSLLVQTLSRGHIRLHWQRDSLPSSGHPVSACNRWTYVTQLCRLRPGRCALRAATDIHPGPSFHGLCVWRLLDDFLEQRGDGAR